MALFPCNVGGGGTGNLGSIQCVTTGNASEIRYTFTDDLIGFIVEVLNGGQATMSINGVNIYDKLVSITGAMLASSYPDYYYIGDIKAGDVFYMNGNGFGVRFMLFIKA